jgi:hypothetical protein
MYHLVVPAGIHKMNVVDFFDNDCAIRAIVHVTSSSYAKIYTTLSVNNTYQMREGTYLQHIFAYLRLQGITPRNIPLNKDTRLRSVLNKSTKGTYLVLAKNHIYAIINGVVCGTGREYPNQRLHKLWRIYPNKELTESELAYINYT